MSVTCFGVTNTAQIAVAEPSGTVRGTITLHTGGAGTGYWGTQPSQPFTKAYLGAGYRTVQVKWSKAWEDGSLGLRHSGCFPATLYRYVFDHVHGADTTKGFCGQGISGGSASIGYSLAHYGLDDIFDYALLVSGPAVSQLAAGCDVPGYAGPAPTLCPSIPSPLYALPKPAIDGSEATSTCDCGSAGCVAPVDAAKWQADGVVSPGATYDHPKTAISFWYCGNANTNGSTDGAFYYDALSAVATNDVSVHCYGGASGPASSCTGEAVFADPTAFADAVSLMTDPAKGCIARH